jgi:hypothetical protein
MQGDVSPISLNTLVEINLKQTFKYVHQFQLEHTDIKLTQKVRAAIYSMSLEVHTKKKTILPGR